MGVAGTQGLPGSIQQPNRPVIRTVQGKDNHQVIEAGSAFLPEAQEPDPQLNSAVHALRATSRASARTEAARCLLKPSVVTRSTRLARIVSRWSTSSR